MTLSTTTTWAATERDLIQSAFRKINQLGDWETMSTSDTRYVNARFVLNALIKSLMAEGMPLWEMQTIAIPCSALTTGTTTLGPTGSGAAVTISAQPLRIQKVVRRDTSVSPNTEVEVEVIPYNSYLTYPQKLNLATPTQLAFVPGRTTTSIYVYAAPDSYWQTNGQMVLRVQMPFSDMTAATDDIDFPSYWHKAVVYLLAYDLSPEYGLAINDRQMLKADAEASKEKALDFGAEDGSVFFQPDRRYRQHGSY